jgi:hypothetical protein
LTWLHQINLGLARTCTACYIDVTGVGVVDRSPQCDVFGPTYSTPCYSLSQSRFCGHGLNLRLPKGPAIRVIVPWVDVLNAYGRGLFAVQEEILWAPNIFRGSRLPITTYSAASCSTLVLIRGACRSASPFSSCQYGKCSEHTASDGLWRCRFKRDYLWHHAIRYRG